MYCQLTRAKLRLARLVSLALICFGTAFPQATDRGQGAQPSVKGHVEGRGLDISGQAIVKADVTLTVSQLMSAAPGPQVRGLTVATDKDGRFVFDAVDPGRYSLSAKKNGFLPSSYGAKNPLVAGVLTVPEDRPISGVTLTMVPYGSISGRVLDEDGDPYSEEPSIAVFQKETSRSRATVREVTGLKGRVINGDFEYAGLAPGDYFLFVLPHPIPRQPGTDRNSTEYFPTFYPNATDIAGAVPIHVTAGANLTNLNVKLAKGQTVSLRGRVIGGDMGKRQAEVPVVHLALQNFPARLRSANIGEDGSFQFTDVARGSYTLSVLLMNSAVSLLPSGAAVHGLAVRALEEVVVPDHDLDVSITLNPLLDLNGTVTMQDQSGSSVPGKGLKVALHSESVTSASRQAQVDAEGKFLVVGLMESTYRLSLQPPKGEYIASVWLGNREIKSDVLDFRPGSADAALNISLRNSSSQIGGEITTEDGGPAQGAVVTLIPESSDAPQWLYKIVSADQYGQFVLADVAPGKYQLFSWDDISADAIHDPTLLDRYKSKAKEISLDENSNRTVSLVLIRPEDRDR